MFFSGGSVAQLRKADSKRSWSRDVMAWARAHLPREARSSRQASQSPFLYINTLVYLQFHQTIPNLSKFFCVINCYRLLGR
jgi:hypothetical protein